METKNAIIKRAEPNVYLVLEVGESPLNIILTEDNPNNIKIAFNALLKELKNGLFQFKLADEVQDLYTHICVEYINQLNAEIKVVYQELVHSKLTTDAK